MELYVSDRRIYALDDALTPEGAQDKAQELKTKAFGMLSGLIMGAKREDIDVTYVERRWEPFWHIACKTHLEYNRLREYSHKVDDEVKAVALDGKTYEVRGGRLILHGTEECVEDMRKELYIDAATGEPGGFHKYTESARRQLKETEELMAGDDIVVPAKVKASYLTRNMIGQMLKPVSADEITAEEINIEKLHLYFRPLYAFEYLWKTKGKAATIEYDAVLLTYKSGGKPLRQKMKELISEPELFDIGADAAGLIIPGGSLAMKVAKRVMAKR